MGIGIGIVYILYIYKKIVYKKGIYTLYTYRDNRGWCMQEIYTLYTYYYRGKVKYIEPRFRSLGCVNLIDSSNQIVTPTLGSDYFIRTAGCQDNHY